VMVSPPGDQPDWRSGQRRPGPRMDSLVEPGCEVVRVDRAATVGVVDDPPYDPRVVECLVAATGSTRSLAAKLTLPSLLTATTKAAGLYHLCGVPGARVRSTAWRWRRGNCAAFMRPSPRCSTHAGRRDHSSSAQSRW
jgi:hypothetical protein